MGFVSHLLQSAPATLPRDTALAADSLGRLLAEDSARQAALQARYDSMIAGGMPSGMAGGMASGMPPAPGTVLLVLAILATLVAGLAWLLTRLLRRWWGRRDAS